MLMDFQDLRSSRMTILLLVLIFAVFLFQGLPLSMPGVTELLNKGANFNPYSASDQPWRMAFSLFMHGGIVHLIVNSSALYILGSSIESKTGPLFILILFLFTGLAANLVSLYLNYFTVSVGASGAIFGLFGYHSAMEVWENRKTPEVYIRTIIFLCIYLFVMVSLGKFLPFDNAAHIGGFITGLLIALLYIFFPFFKKSLSLMALFPLLILAWLFIPDTQQLHFRQFQEIVRQENKFRESDYKSDEEAALKNEEFIVVFDSLSTEFADSLNDHNELLLSDRKFLSELAKVRSMEAFYMSRLIREESYRYLDSIELARDFKFIELNYPLSLNKPADTEPGERESMPELKRVFYDSSWQETSMRKAVYYRLGFKDSLNRWNGQVEDYYLDGSIQMKGSYTSGLRDGIFRYYNPDSTYDAVGRYDTEYKVGKWEYFHNNGKLYQIIRYEDRPYLQEAYDYKGKQQVINGEGDLRTFYKDGTLKTFMPYREGLREGRAFGLYPDSTLKYQERYERGRFILGEAYQNNKTVQYDVSSFYPSPQGGFERFSDYIRQRLEANPELIDGSEVKLLFSCSFAGEIYDIRVLESSGNKRDSIAVNWLQNGPAWNPALQNGLEPVTTEGVVDIVFSVSNSD